ncbi:uncharacterized protein At3g06530-like [Chenopodium quinoa]|uniref:BP28 C-terminal domain-containing protein n=1 Tax=Chenopodium quinoa TaxID=63459 RepID=A0A803M9T7_CHEQI|nr:uncharacterized protein At3g06530-like [Chenopodium quinoa]
MAATSIAAQLQALKSYVKADTEVPKRPITRPSVLFNPKEAADLDIDTILSLALSGLEVLEKIDDRFTNHKHDLFSHKSRDLDRELMGIEENKRINSSISAYLHLLSGHFQSPSAFKTLEYLIRRYKIHVYNVEELILFALPYHDTHAFVRIVQLIDLGNSRWKFLDGVKGSGAPPPREVFVQQCIRDMGVLEVICTYATPVKKHKPATPMISFCTAVVVEVLGSLATVDSDTVKRILPFLNSGLQSGGKGSSDYKAGTLMIVGLLANRVSLSSKLVSSLVRSVAELAQADAQASAELQWVQLSIMALINIVQLQSVETLPKKVVDILKEIEALPGILSQMTTRFNIDRFLTVLLESLIDYSISDSRCKLAVVSIIDTVIIKGLVRVIVFRLLSACVRLSQNTDNLDISDSGSFAKQILLLLNKKYPNELRSSVNEFLNDKKVQLKGENSVVESLCKMLDGNITSSVAFTDSKVWFGLENPKAEIRRATLTNLDLSTFLNGGVTSERLVTVQEAVVHCLSDEDLSVVQAALSLDKLSELIDSARLLEMFQYLLQKCTQIIWSGASENLSLAGEVAILCLKHAVSFLQDRTDFVEQVATMTFPFIFVFPRTKKLNLKAQKLAKEIKWPFYRDLILASDVKKDLKKKSGKEWVSGVNMPTVCSLVNVFSEGSKELMPWLIKCCTVSELSKTLFFLILLQSFIMQKNAFHQFSTLYETCYAFIKAEWKAIEQVEHVLRGQEFSSRILDSEDNKFLNELDENNLKNLNARILVFVFWRAIKAYISVVPTGVDMDEDGKWMRTLQDFYAFFAESNLKHVFKEHKNYLVQNCKVSPIHFLSAFVSDPGVSTRLQIESLHSFAMLCSQADEGSALQHLGGFPLTLVPLSSDDQDIRAAAINYVEELNTLCSRVKYVGKKNGNNDIWSSSIDELLSLLVQHKKLIISDRDFLPSLMASILSSSFQSLLVPLDVGQKLDKSTIDRILTFILGSAMKFPGYAKLKVLSLLKELGVSIMRVKDVESLLCDLLQRRYSYHFKLDKSHRELSGIDVDILCLLIEICSMPISSDIHIVEDHLLPALCIEGLLPDDAAIVRPCVAFLQKLNGNLYRSLSSETQQKLFQQLVLLYHDANNDVQNATREALLRLDVSASTVASILNIILVYEGDLVASPHRKKKSKKHNAGLFSGGRSALSSISSLLDVLLLKKDMGNRAVLIEPLFQLLRKAFTDKWVRAVTQEEWVPALSGIAQTTSNALSYIQQTVLLILEDIISSLSDDLSLNNGVFDKFDAALLVECAQSASDVVTSNHVYSLFATIAKVEPGKILHYIPAILAVISKSTVYHDDSHSKRVFEGLVSTVVPCWLSKMDGADNLLQIFINEMPGVAQHRRLSITLHLLKTLGESSSMGSLLVLLFRSLVSKERFSSLHNEIDTSGFINSVVQTEWEYNFAEQICEQYTCLIWLPSLVSLLKQLQGGVSDNNQCVTLLFALKFVSGKLQNPEVVMKLQSMEDMETIQKTLTELMVQVVFCWQFIDLSKKKTSLPIFLKKELKEIIHAVLMKITNGMLPSAFFQGVIRLLVQTDKGPRKKTLQVLCKSVRDLDAFKSKHERERNVHLRGSWNHLDGIDLDSFAALCLEILQLVDGSDNDLNVSVRLAAISALEILANKFPSNHAVFSKCLAIVVQNVLSDDLAVSSGCLRTAGALINVLGPRALPELPEIMKNVLQRTRAVSPSSGARKESAEDNNIQTSSKDTLMLAVLVTLEALVENLGAFLNPYLGDIVEIVLLHQDFVSESNQKIKSQADNVRRLVSEKVPVRLALPALQNVYTKAVKAGDLSLSTVFELLKNFVSKMDKSSVSGYHTNIFDLCMMALDLRSQHLASIKNINFVEKHVISAMIALTMKMTETMFKPLFLRSIEWVESSLAETNHMGPRNIGRAVSFYNLVNKLAENHRSLFVPYFKYLLEGFISFLSDNDDKASQSRKKKKAKIQNSESKKNEAVDSLSLEKWHLRALVLSSLHKCFLYDTGSVKFLDSTKFQLLLKPIVSQLIVEPPACIEDHPDIPSLEEADEILVSCVGQMAVTAGSDLLWKPLNYEVLMQTRSEMVRSRLLGLRIIKYLVENLKEEYLVLLAETIPFLAELLEDVELPVKTLAQEILKELESLSGENLQEYF